MQAMVQPGLYDGFGEIQIGGDLARRPAQVVRHTNHLTMRREQLIEGIAHSSTIEQLVHLVSSGRVDPPEPTSVAVRGHEVDAAFIMRPATSLALETIDKWLASSSIVVAFMRFAMNRSRSGLWCGSYLDAARPARGTQNHR